MSPRNATLEYQSRLLDFSRGIVGGVSDVGRKVEHCRFADNVVLRPHRAVRVRPGSRRLSTGTLTKKPHTLGKWRPTGGAGKLFAACEDGATSKIYEVTPSAFTLQTTPTIGLDRGRFEQLNNTLWYTWLNNAGSPIFFNASNPANTWHEMKLPKPGNTLTLTPNTGGNLANAIAPGITYWYRLRWVFDDGSSLASAPQSVALITPNNRVDLTTIPNSTRSDYVGWTLERSKQTGSATGEFYVVKRDDTGATSYIDTTADADLFSLADEALHGEPPAMDAMIAHKDRLMGWKGSFLYVSQLIADTEDTGLCNWDGQNAYRFGGDDGDEIKACVKQADRLIVFKARSVWALEGDDPLTFRVVLLYEGAGARSLRCTTSMGQRVWFYGEGGLHVMDGNKIRPFGWVEIGHYLDTIDRSADERVVLLNYLGQFFFMWYPATAADPDELIVYDQRFSNWTHFRGWTMRDAFVQRDGDFSDATLIFADPRNRGDISALAFADYPVFVAWDDTRVATNQTYIQKLNSSGAPQWTANGVQVSNNGSAAPAFSSAILGLGPGQGCIVAYTDRGSAGVGDLYIQKLNDAGAVQWTAGGVQLTATSGGSDRSQIRIVSDGAGGAIVVWLDMRSGNYRVYAQRVDSTGAVLWTANGVQVSTANTEDRRVSALADGAGGVYILFDNGTTSGGGTRRARVKRLDSAGAAVAGWGANGNDVDGVDGITSNFRPVLCSDDAGGCIVVYADSGVRAQRFNGAGARQWGTGGVAVMPSLTHAIDSVPFRSIECCRDGTGGVIVHMVAHQTVDETARRIHGGRVSAAGVSLWGSSGELIHYAVDKEVHDLQMVPDGDGGATSSWVVKGASGTDRDIYAMRVNESGTLLWTNPTFVVSQPSTAQQNMVMCTDGAGGMVAAWWDSRISGNDGFYGKIANTGAQSWTPEGAALVASAGDQRIGSIAMTAAAASDFPTSDANYILWAGMDGFRDERAADGTGGIAVDVAVELPAVDDGMPDEWKEYIRAEMLSESDVDTTVTFSVTTLPTELVEAIQDTITGSGAVWGGFVWGGASWASNRESVKLSGFRNGLIGKRYRARMSASCLGDFSWKGFIMDVKLMPERRMS